MVSLVDIVPQTRTVALAAGELELRGLGLRQLAELLLRFPELRKLFVGEGAPELDATTLLIGAPEAVGLVIAEAAGQPDAADKIVDVGGGLSPDEILECLAAVIELTFPRGVVPLMQRLTVLLGGATAGGLFGRAQDTSSPPAPNGSLPADTMSAP